MKCSALLWTLLVISGLAGCAQSGGDGSRLPVQEMTGHYRKDASGSWFTPCAGSPGTAPGAAPVTTLDTQPMWVTLTGAAVSQYRPAAEPPVTQFVRWRAAITRDGSVGPRGPGAPALLVREVLEQRAAGDADCVAATR